MHAQWQPVMACDEDPARANIAGSPSAACQTLSGLAHTGRAWRPPPAAELDARHPWRYQTPWLAQA